LENIDNKALATISYIIAYITGIVLWIPGAIFMVFGAFIWGRVYGQYVGFSIFVFIDLFCHVIGQFLAFLNARYLFKNWVQKSLLKKPRLRCISKAISENGKKMIALWRSSWLVPYFIFNNLWGVTEVPACDYFFGSFFTIVWNGPFIFTLAGISEVSKLSTDPRHLGVVAMVVTPFSILLSIVISILVFIYARKELKKILAKVNGDSNKNNVDPNENESHSQNHESHSQNHESHSQNHESHSQNHESHSQNHESGNNAVADIKNTIIIN
jgi:uncharacterized membrane protein YdjX (TVP38/TMEM64 family)